VSGGVQEMERDKQMTKVKPCPFCGEAEDLFIRGLWEPKLNVLNEKRVLEFHGFCFLCKARGPTAASKTWAVRKWNKTLAGKKGE
jgi:hypothetical protein